MGRPRFSCPVLEINIISAQDLAGVARNMKTYAVACINTEPMRKLTTRVDQTNRANPIWNEKFVFRVNDKILDVDASAIIIEIYAAAWTKDALVGSVNVLLSDLFAPWSGFSDNDGGGNNNMRLVTLQVRRPSGRLQGFLRLGVALLDGTQRSMPISIEVFDGSNHREKSVDDGNIGKGSVGGGMLRRTHSDQTDMTTSTDEFGLKTGVVSSGGGRVTGGGGGGGGGGCGGTDSMVNGSLCSSDIGPSASVVAAAIAQGLYNRQKPPANKEDTSSILEGTTEGVKHRLERWRNETTPSYQNADSSDNSKHRGDSAAAAAIDASDSSGKGESRRRWRKGSKGTQRRRGDDGRDGRKGLFSCFGNVFGCEISITCGGGGGGSSKKGPSKNKVANLSAVDETYSSTV